MQTDLVKKSDIFENIEYMTDNLGNGKFVVSERNIRRIPTYEINGETSDGRYTFNELYQKIDVLFCVLCNKLNSRAWKSKKYNDDSCVMRDGLFVVGFETDEGPIVQHYNIDSHWELFDVEEVERAPAFQSENEEMSIERLKSIIQN